MEIKRVKIFHNTVSTQNVLREINRNNLTHGDCLNTLKELLKKWDKTTEQLIFVGDLIDRGNFSPETVQLVKQLVKVDDAVCLMGNHEYAAIKAILIDKKEGWFKEFGLETVRQYKDGGFRIKNDLKWLNELPLVWQNEKFVISHAGIAKNVANPFDKTDKDSVLWTRNTLKNISKNILTVIPSTDMAGL